MKAWSSAWSDWLLDCELRQLSKQTVATRKIVGDKLDWLANREGFGDIGTPELRRFLAYLSTGHDEAGGRWGNAKFTEPVKARTVQTYHGHLKSFCRWLLDEDLLDLSPIDRIKTPIARQDQIQPFTLDQVRALIRSCQGSAYPKRDEAIVLTLFDTGCRATELAQLRVNDVDMSGRRGRVLGKGNKKRDIFLGKRATRAVWSWLKEYGPDDDDPLFIGERGISAGEALTRSGVLRIVTRLGKRANIEATRCSPHIFRHTFAICFLRNGGDPFELKELLGHSTLAMTNRYVALAKADIQKAHRAASPADHLFGVRG